MVKKHYFLIFTLIFSGSAAIFGMENNQKPLDSTYPKNGTIEQQKHWLRTYYKENNIQPNPEVPKNVEVPKKAGSSLLAPVKWIMNSKAPLARYTRYGLAAAAVGTVLFFPEQAGKILLKDNIYNSMYQGIRYGFADMVGSAVKAPVLKNIGLSLAYTCLGYQGIKNAASIKRSIAAGVKNKYTQAKNWCLNWVREPR